MKKFLSGLSGVAFVFLVLYLFTIIDQQSAKDFFSSLINPEPFINSFK